MTTDTSLIEFPCDFQIKIMGNNTPTFLKDISQLAYDHFTSKDVVSISSKPSNQGNYLAISLTVHVQDKQSLDKLYLALTQQKDVKMVL